MRMKQKNILKKVSQYSVEGVYIKTYRSLSAAAKDAGIDVRTIKKTFSTKQQAGGYYWREGEDKSPIDFKEVKQAFVQHKIAISSINSKKVSRYTLEGQLVDYYSSIKEAAHSLNISKNSLYEALKGRQHATKGYIWKYVDSSGHIPPCIKIEKPEPASQKSELRKKFGLTTFQYPYQDMNLIDMEGEIWKPVSGLEEYCLVSNFGRIKKLSRYVNGPFGARIFLEEKICKQSVRHSHLSKQRNEYSTILYFKIQIDRVVYQIPVARAIYSAFVNPLKDFFEENIFILHHDLNPYNNIPENLYQATHEEMIRRNYREGLLFITTSPEKTEKMNRAVRKPVSQYDRDGKFIRSFNSITDAAKFIGTCHSCISQVARGKEQKSAAGYIWRFGNDSASSKDIAPLKYINPWLHLSKPVKQYDMEETLMTDYPSISIAAKAHNLDHRKLSALLKKVTELQSWEALSGTMFSRNEEVGIK